MGFCYSFVCNIYDISLINDYICFPCGKDYMQGRYYRVRDEWHALDTATSSHSAWNKGKPVANTSPLTTTAVKTKFMPQPAAVALHVSFRKPNLIPCDGLAK